MEESMAIGRIKEHQRAFVAEREWEPFHTPKNLAMALTGEVGELVELFQWLDDEKARHIMRDPRQAMAVRHELADVFFYLVRLSDVLGVDLEEAFWEKMKQNAEKYPVDKAKGNHMKYTEY